MVFTNKYAKLLIDKFPDFAESKTLLEEFDFRGEDTMTMHALFNSLTDYLVTEVIPSDISVTPFEIELYNFLEDCRSKFKLCSEDSEEGEFDNAICTCFLENLLNQASWDSKLYDRFIPYLGSNSIEFCKEWDKFTGVPSPGLWTEEEWAQANKSE